MSQGKAYKGFVIICTSCNQTQTTVEARQDGVDFQCRYCGNKLLMRPGEIMKIVKPNRKPQQNISPKPKQDEKIEDKEKQFELDLDFENKVESLQRRNIPKDDWANEILEEFYRRQEEDE